MNGKIIVDGTTKVQAFEAGEVDALDAGGLPPDETARLKQTPEYEAYPALGTYFYGLNLENLPTSTSGARSRSRSTGGRSWDQIAQADQVPATGFSPEGLPGIDPFRIRTRRGRLRPATSTRRGMSSRRRTARRPS